jgi:hypothetical protein
VDWPSAARAGSRARGRMIRIEEARQLADEYEEIDPKTFYP